MIFLESAEAQISSDVMLEKMARPGCLAWQSANEGADLQAGVHGLQCAGTYLITCSSLVQNEHEAKYRDSEGT